MFEGDGRIFDGDDENGPSHKLEWLVEDRNTFIIKRIRPQKSFLKKKIP